MFIFFPLQVGFTAVCEYAITCNRPNFNSEPNPENTRGEWGPGAEVGDGAYQL